VPAHSDYHRGERQPPDPSRGHAGRKTLGRDRDPRINKVYVDASGVAGIGRWSEKRALIAERLRQVGLDRVLYGSDGTTARFNPSTMLASYASLPLSDAEFRTIAGNVAPYMR
jgi:predicted TIM-barrel fold metal-dependent hydrolase